MAGCVAQKISVDQNGAEATWHGRGPRPGVAGFHPPPHQPSPGGSASATPPQGGSDLEACIRRSSITPPLRGSRREGGARSRAGGGQTRRPGRVPRVTTSRTGSEALAASFERLRASRRSHGAPSADSIRTWIMQASSSAIPEPTASPDRLRPPKAPNTHGPS